MDRDPGFSEDSLERVLQRAIELDTIAGTRTSEEELRVIAHELGVTETSLATAIRELREPSPPVSQPPRWSWRALLTPAAAGVMTGAGFMSAAVRMNPYGFSDLTSFTVAGGVVALASALATWRARDRSQSYFHATNTILWIGAFAGILLADPITTTSAIANQVLTILVAEGWVVSTLIGSLVGLLRAATRAQAPTRTPAAPPSDGGTASGMPSRWRSVVRGWFPWIHSITFRFNGAGSV